MKLLTADEQHELYYELMDAIKGTVRRYPLTAWWTADALIAVAAEQLATEPDDAARKKQLGQLLGRLVQLTEIEVSEYSEIDPETP